MIILRGCAGWFAYVLFPNSQRQFFSHQGSKLVQHEAVTDIKYAEKIHKLAWNQTWNMSIHVICSDTCFQMSTLWLSGWSIGHVPVQKVSVTSKRQTSKATSFLYPDKKITKRTPNSAQLNKDQTQRPTNNGINN